MLANILANSRAGSKEGEPTIGELANARWEKEEKWQEDNASWSEVSDVALIAKEGYDDVASIANDNIANIAKKAIAASTWLGNSAASCQLCNDDNNIVDWTRQMM